MSNKKLFKYSIPSSSDEIGKIEISKYASIINSNLLNKGLAFTDSERENLNLYGYLPNGILTLDQQIKRESLKFSKLTSDIEKHYFLENLYLQNATLFFALFKQNLAQMLPIVYTPIIAAAIKKFSYQNRSVSSLYLSYKDADRFEKILNTVDREIRYVVISDGGRILGIGDQGAGAIDICFGKQLGATAIAGVNPYFMMPIGLDVGTDNQDLINDPNYCGLKEPRLSGPKYFEVIDKLVKALTKRFPGIYIHWEDFNKQSARAILQKYQTKICTFNDDLQGTGMMTASMIIAYLDGLKLEYNKKIVIFGAGTAGCGIADYVVKVLVHRGINQKDAENLIYLIDKDGFITTDTKNIFDFQAPYVHDASEIKNWKLNGKKIDLLTVLENIDATVLIGVSTVAGAFTEEIIKTMASKVEHPLILPLSNPDYKAEAKPADIIPWTKGKAIVATGTRFPDVTYEGKLHKITQGNNIYLYPAIALVGQALQPRLITDKMLIKGIEALASLAPFHKDIHDTLLPPFAENIFDLSFEISSIIAKAACDSKVVDMTHDEAIEMLKRYYWKPIYREYILKK